MVKATIDALANMRDPFTIAQQRGVSLKKYLTDNSGGRNMAKLKLHRLKAVSTVLKTKKLTLEALGLKRLNRFVEHEATPQILGMIAKVKHLVKVENI